MAGFHKDYILEKITEMEDLEYSSADFMTQEDIPEDAPEELKELLSVCGKVVGMDYADLGEDSYDAYGIFYFLPDAEEDPCCYLAVSITMDNQVPKEAISDLYRLINRINVRIGEGAFVLTQDEKSLYYRYNIPLLKDADDETTLHNAGLRIFDSVALVSVWIDVLMGRAEGELSMEECLKRTATDEE